MAFKFLSVPFSYKRWGSLYIYNSWHCWLCADVNIDMTAGDEHREVYQEKGWVDTKGPRTSGMEILDPPLVVRGVVFLLSKFCIQFHSSCYDTHTKDSCHFSSFLHKSSLFFIQNPIRLMENHPHELVIYRFQWEKWILQIPTPGAAITTLER